MSRRSTRPKPRGAPEQLDELFRHLGKPDPSLIAALLDGTSEVQLVERAAKAPAPLELVQFAISIITRAYEHWQKLPADKRKILRGCSQHLFALAVEQARQLQHLHHQQVQRNAEDEQTKVHQRRVLDQAKHVCNQTKGVVMKVAGSRPSIQLALNEKVVDVSTPYGMICNLKYLADTSRSLLQLPAPAIRGRATLYGLDKNFIDSLDSLAEELLAQEKNEAARPSKVPGQPTATRARAVLFFLLSHICDVFETARQIDPATPELRKPEHSSSGTIVAARPMVPTARATAAVRPPQGALALQIPRIK